MNRTTIALMTAFAVGGASVVLLPAEAYGQEAAAEKYRLEEEMKKLAKRNAWAGVERAYEQLLELNIDLPFEDHMTGAQSARFLGKTHQVYMRLERAKAIDPQPDVVQELESIDASYGRIEIVGNIRKRIPLERATMPFNPDQRKSIEYAMSVVEETGSFKGMLPSGPYKVGAQEFTVEPGPEWQKLEVQTKGVKAPAGGNIQQEGLILYAGPVVMLGPSFATTPAPSAGEYAEVEPGDISGAGAVGQLGFELGFTPTIGTAVTVGYRGLFGTNDTLHDINGWLALTIRPGNLRVAVGPAYGLILGEGAGVADWFDQGQDEDTDLTSVKYGGLAAGPGANLGVGYGLLNFGKLQGIVELSGSWKTDGDRSYIGAGLQVGIVPKPRTFEQK